MSVENGERYKIIPAVHTILMKDDKLLLLRRINTGFGDGQFDTISGHGEPGEFFSEAAIREAREEAGVEIRPENLHPAHFMNIKTQEGDRVHVFFVVNQWTGEPIIAEPTKSDKIDWFPVNLLPENTLTYVAKAIELIQQGQNYSETAYP